MVRAMYVSATVQTAGISDADTVAVGVFDGEDPPALAPAQLGELLGSGEARRSFKALAQTHVDGKRWLLVGLGPRAEFTPERARVAASVVCSPCPGDRGEHAVLARAGCLRASGGGRTGRGHPAQRLPLRAAQVGGQLAPRRALRQDGSGA